MNVPSTEEIAERIAPYGDTSRGIRASKPDDNGLIQYIWRMARFHTGADTCMPVTAFWWLQDYLDSRGIDANVSGISDSRGKEITKQLDQVVTEVVRDEFGLDDTAAVRRWSRLL
jgi:hypothetical protein